VRSSGATLYTVLADAGTGVGRNPSISSSPGKEPNLAWLLGWMVRPVPRDSLLRSGGCVALLLWVLELANSGLRTGSCVALRLWVLIEVSKFWFAGKRIY